VLILQKLFPFDSPLLFSLVKEFYITQYMAM
jgi:hypothetical protein